jgi:transcriptional regulator with XRE-family HTH domain
MMGVAMATITDVREKKGWTQRQLAGHAGVSYVTVSRIENGHPVGKIYIARVCNALEVSIDSVEGLIFLERKRK